GFVPSVETAKHVVFGRPANVVANEEIKKAIAIVVEPQCGSAQALAAEKVAGARGVYEGTFAGVAEETALADASDENVREAIVVVIPNGYAHSVHFDVEPRALGDVGKGAVAVVAVEAQRRALALMAGPVHAVKRQRSTLRSEEPTSELQSQSKLVCRLLLEK